MKITVNLRGWADGLSPKRHKKLEFPLQAAMYEVIGDCDWDFDIRVRSKNGDVRHKHEIKVRAERVCAGGGGECRVERVFERYEFSFTVLSYTIENVYKGAKEELIKMGQK